MTYQFVTVDKTDRVATVRFDRGNAANALSPALMRELTDVALALADDATLCAVVLTGRDDNFCLGMDLKDAEVALAVACDLRVMGPGATCMCRRSSVAST